MIIPHINLTRFIRPLNYRLTIDSVSVNANREFGSCSIAHTTISAADFGFISLYISLSACCLSLSVDK